MVFVRTSRTDAYFSRYQVKCRRRRSGQTDYQQRKKLIINDKNKYATPKHRLVVRFTNKRVLAQVTYSTLTGDKIIASAESNELPRYGLKVGLKNYPACYCVGLLIGRRVLQMLGLDTKYTGVGNEEDDAVNAEIMSCEFNKRKYFVDQLDEERRPFRCFLDVGLARTSSGSRIWGVLKGAADAGLDIPHSPNRFPGFDKASKSYDAEVHRQSIFGEPIKEYMETLIEDDAESGTDRFGEQFGCYKANGIGPDDMEDLYKKVHKAIRADPSKAHKDPVRVRNANKKHDLSRKRKAPLTKVQRDAAIQVKLGALKAKKSGDAAAAGGDDDEKEEDGEGY